MDMNEEKNAADYKDFILPPASLTATQGESKAVVLTWTAVKNAVQYQVFAAESPFSTFSKVSETTSTETEITIEEEAGITKYYCISAVNYYGTVSSKSVVAMGSTLAVPIITAIDASEEGNSVTVSWWMDNCSSDTYAADVSFNVNVYALSAPNIKFKTITVDGDTRQVEIDGLTSKTEYYFEVEVVKNDSTSKECSEKTSAETAHRVIPDAPLDFTVTQGDSVSAVTLSWTLPEEVWYRENAGVSGFSLHPLYFVIYRKLSSAPDSEYKKVKELHYDPYEAGASKTWDDELYDDVNNEDGVERGKKYSYYIQSITDDTPEGKIITAESSKTDVIDGWLITEPRFSIKTEYVEDPDNSDLFSEIYFSYELDFETFGKSYSYFVVRSNYNSDKELINNSDPEKFISISELNKTKDSFENLTSTATYYKYTLYVCPNGDTEISNSYINVQANGYFLVTNDATAVPLIENFIVNYGYKDHFDLSWKYNADYNYIIHWTDVINDVEQTEQTLEVLASDPNLTINNGIATYNHGAESGDRRIYSLEASTGLSFTARPNNNTTDVIYETLGTAQPQVLSYDYDKICVKWPAVQQAGDNFIVSAKYQDDNNTELVVSTGENQNIQITNIGTTEEPVYECIILKPAGYNDAQKSGKLIDLKVTASNDKDSTESSALNVYTIGPALTKATIDTNTQAESIGVKWDPIADGVDGYIIRRIAYKTTDYLNLKTRSDTINVYYYNLLNNTLYADGEAVTSDRAEVNIVNGMLKLTDKYKEASSNINPYEVTQGIIAWGIPFGYTVIPVKKGGDKDDFTCAGKNVTINGISENYDNINELEDYGSTTGYGFKVHAEKSESADTQVIKWNVPYNTNASPAVYYRDTGSENNSWTKVDSTLITLSSINGYKQTASFTPQEITAAYEYLVAYGKTAATLINQVPVSFINDGGSENSLGLSALEDDSSYDYTNVASEKANKGYLLAVNYHASTGADYSEVASWDRWDYSYRSIGPTSANVLIKNYNLSDSWVAVAVLDKDLQFVDTTHPVNTSVDQFNDPVSIILVPDELMNDNSIPITKGPLQVLRDAKHYYSLELIRGSNSVIVDNSVYTYRNINDFEFAKMVMAVMSNAFVNVGKLDFESKSDGTASFTHNSTMNIGKEYEYNFANYSPTLNTPSSFSVNSVSVSCKGICTRNMGTQGGYPKEFQTVDITVFRTDDKMPSSYAGTLKFSLSSHNNASITSRDTAISLNSDAKRRIFVPFKLYGDETNYYQNASYGWWTE